MIGTATAAVMSGKNVLVTGPGGSGKSTFVDGLNDYIPTYDLVRSAPSGLAAVNIKGVTCHNLFGLSLTPFIPDMQIKKRKKINALRKMQFSRVVIDEVSTLRADKLQEIDTILRKARDSSLPFGGTQIILTGDLLQLEAVTTPEDSLILQPHYRSSYFFDSKAFIEAKFETIKLEKVHRQKDTEYVQNLCDLREGRNLSKVIEFFNERCYYNSTSEDYSTILAPTNSQVDRLNSEFLDEIKSPPYVFKAIKQGKYCSPAPENLILKIGAKVMILVNNEDLYSNGTVGTVIGFEPSAVLVQLENGEVHAIKMYKWEAVTLEPTDTGDYEEVVVGSFVQYPLKLCWAISYHKSQGKTLSGGYLELGSKPLFANQMLYVGLSRFKSLENVHLSRPLTEKDIKINPRLLEWWRSI